MSGDAARREILDQLRLVGREPADYSGLEYQLLAWRTLPLEDGPRPDVTEACADLLESTGRPRLAAAMRRHNAEVTAAWTRSEDEGLAAGVAASDATGIAPPDTPVLA
ncbi:hypothetical protein [Pseudonocardia nigra]|uniref:hypothetical protein n=1 Tax=Pseudonocardia nigra TaxID=1921578 RepID=UPI001C5D26B1|nr:hypothetical protein [Pseudonocardia nigra]